MRPVPTACRMSMARFFRRRAQPVSGEFLVNQFTSYNQRTPAVAALANGGFVVAWVSEQERTAAPDPGQVRPPVITASDSRFRAWIFMRGFTTAVACAQGDEFLGQHGFQSLRQSRRGGGSDGSFVVAWDARDMTNPRPTAGHLCPLVFQRGRRRHGAAGEHLSLRRPICAAHQFAGNGLFDCRGRAWGRTVRAKAFTDNLCTAMARWWAANSA